MFLTQIDFSEHRGQPNEWVLEGVELKKETLLAGKNATGKTRCLNVINALATLLSGKVGPHSNGDWQCTFTKGKDNYKYRLVIQDQKVKLETLKLRNTKFIDRADGKSRIRF